MNALPPLLALLMTAGPALSLSCIRPDPVRSYQQAADAEEVYLLVTGTLSHDPASVPPKPEDGQSATMPATLTGAFLNADRFEGAFAAPVTVSLDCVASWCGQMPEPSAEVLAFLQETPTGYALSLGPCGGWMFVDPTEAQIERVVACHTGGDCAVED